ncbi:MAG: sulfate ABC transporter substrate-binding protein, partial [Afipia sp.]|nr:sulfate ABC transporter substrate-binding protein [Afipia sp.]
VDKKGTRKIATAYLEYLYTSEGQTILAQQYNRVNDKAVAEKFKDKFPAVKLVTIEKEFGGWDKVNAEHLNPGAKLDQLFGGANK